MKRQEEKDEEKSQTDPGGRVEGEEETQKKIGVGEKQLEA